MLGKVMRPPITSGAGERMFRVMAAGVVLGGAGEPLLAVAIVNIDVERTAEMKQREI
jgi:hypothetical protein